MAGKYCFLLHNPYSGPDSTCDNGGGWRGARAEFAPLLGKGFKLLASRIVLVCGRLER